MRASVRFSAILSLATACVCVKAGDVQDRSLIGCWHFDAGRGRTAYDSSPMMNDGRISGAQWASGRFGKALDLDGKDDYVTARGFRRMAAGTLEVWVNFRKRPSGQVGVTCLGNDYGKKNDVCLLGFPPGPAAVRGRIGFGICVSDWKVIRSSVVPKLGQWYHLAAAWDGRGMRLFVNGKLEAACSDGPGSVPAHQAMLIGAGSWGAVICGAVDEVRVYRRALTDEEIARHYSSPDYAGSPTPVMGRAGIVHSAEVNAADFFSDASPTCGIQDAIDSLPNRGGAVRIPAGRYVLRRAIQIHGSIALRGSGAATVLTRGPQAASALAEAGKKGARVIRVKSVACFRVGDEVGVHDTKKLRGWYITHANIAAIRGAEIELDRPLRYDYVSANGAGVINYHPFIRAERVGNVTVSDLLIDGNIEENPGPFNDFTFAAIHFRAVSDSRVLRVSVRGHPSDGIGIQGGANNIVAECVVSGCRGHGFHPGTSLKWSVFSDNVGYENSVDGLYFCANVRGCTMDGNVFHHNGGDGIGGLGGGGDTFNVVSNNVCESNGRCGIEAIGGQDNTIAGNICLNNSQSAPGKFSGILVKSTRNTLVTGNQCVDSQEKHTQKYGVEESGKSEGNLITGNLCRGNAAGGLSRVSAPPRGSGEKR